MVNIAINVLWFLIGLIVLCGIIYLAIWVIESFVYAIPEKVKQGVWVIVLLLALIALLTAILKGGSFPRIGSGPTPALSAPPTGHLPGLLT